MKRIDIIDKIGKQYLEGNIESGEFSYSKALKNIRKNINDYLNSSNSRKYNYADLRFVNEKLSIIVETKYELKEYDLDENIKQLQQYVTYEEQLTGNKIVAILASTTTDEIYVWNDGTNNISNVNIDKREKVIKSFEEYYDMYFGTKNDKKAIVKNTYELNETLHNYSIREGIRSQFVGTCLLSLKNGLKYKGLSNKQIRAGIEEVLTNLLDKDLNKANKLTILKNKVVESQDVRDLKDIEFQIILKEIEDNILPYINDKSSLGQDLLNLFFTTFNKYVGKTDKNQAFTPDHIVHFMTKVVGVNRNSVVLDPCSGSGAFLVRAMAEAIADCDTDEEKTKVKNKHIFGVEYEENAYGLSTTNMLIHGDGNSNIIQGSCFKVDNFIDVGVDVVLMNPPYNAQRRHSNPEYVKNWSAKQKEDPSKGLHYVHYIANKVRKGKLAVLLPLQCAMGTTKDIKEFKRKMLEEHTLDAVFSLPSDMFYPGANAVACCMIFNLGTRHKNSPFKGTFFGFYKDDGFEKRKNLGRLERKKGIWKEIENEWLELYFNRESKKGISIVKEVDYKDEWLAEAYMETDYSQLNSSDFQSVLNNYLGYLISNGRLNN
ncbi:HsdM family class I SAM-dependent methyltransferase [Staphylococcus haemolyticus]|uniref:HsdM family class I SAM-dependent methyltransferase n=3 Tax=Staphylococcus haemolyticus TaxID=1283 RepID=UPI001879C0D0|nr:N-6 DNA methylase [Staphylococcus haemolyticus]MBE7297121.1 N-6 DNA methylase [Staphylococcus haemolyticus]